jgi:hypothetical protein
LSEQSRSEHILELSKELLDDIELSRTNVENLILKASRLARWVGSEEVRQWLKFEMGGYNSSDELSLKYMGLTGRWIDKEKNTGYWGPLAQQEAAIDAQKAKLAGMRTPDSSGEWAGIAIANVTRSMSEVANIISKLSGIKSRVLAHLHTFVTEIYYEKEFDNLSESIFEKYKKDVDILIGTSCGNVLEQIPSVMSRLAEGNQESISQALTTCRRILESFADSIFPPIEDTIEIGGNQLSLNASKYQNRINAYIHQRIESSTRKIRFRQNLSNLFDRVSTGVHKDVTAEEARALFLNTYLIIGEILHLPKNNV